MNDDKLFTRDFILLCIAQLCCSLSGSSIAQIMPLYFLDAFNCDKTMLGMALTAFFLAALLARPFSGWATDSFPLKGLFMLALLPMALFFPLYLFLGNIHLAALLRAVHGLVFAFTTTSISALAIRVIPPQKLGTGLGLFSSLLSISMIIGPSTGLFVLETFGYTAAFMLSCTVTLCALLCALPLRRQAPAPRTARRVPLSSQFFREGIPVSVVLCIATCVYALCLNYMSVYAREHGLLEHAGSFFLVMGGGLFFSRIFSGWLADHGMIIAEIACAIVLVAVAGLVMGLCEASLGVFLTVGTVIGSATGMLQPACHMILVRFGGPERIGAANSLFFIGMDTGIVITVLSGGIVADLIGLNAAFCIAGALQLAGLAVFLFRVAPLCRKMGI